MLGSFLIVSGAFRIGAGLVIRYPNWGWAILSGLVSVLLGGAILAHWPYDSDEFIGIVVGIELIFRGWGYVMLGFAARNLTHGSAT